MSKIEIPVGKNGIVRVYEAYSRENAKDRYLEDYLDDRKDPSKKRMIFYVIGKKVELLAFRDINLNFAYCGGGDETLPIYKETQAVKKKLQEYLDGKVGNLKKLKLEILQTQKK